MGFGGSGGGGGSGAIGGATDVALNSPSNNQVLTYDSSIEKWKNAASSGGGGSTTSANITDASTIGRSILTAANAAAIKTTLSVQNVDNTSDINKPVSSATQTALNAKADAASSQVIVRYNSSTNSWPARPTGAAWGVLYLSTNSTTAAAPNDANLAAGDRWLRHPNAI